MSQIQKIAADAVSLLADLTVIPQVVGYDHRIRQLDEARFIIWVSGEGYFISPTGREFLASVGVRP